MPTLFFADLVREMCHEGGTGPLTPTGAVPGHRRFAGTVPTGTPFHYAVAGIAHPGQWEVGQGRIDSSGRLARDAVAASSQGGAPVDFAPGLKSLALTVAADWFAASDGAAATLNDNMLALADAIDSRQPLSTMHGAAANGVATDQLTVRRGGGWVNIPLSSLAFRGGDGRFTLGVVLAVANGTEAAPGIGFAADLDTGLTRPAADSIGFVGGGGEKMRLTATGNLGIGTGSPGHRLHVRGASICVESAREVGGYVQMANAAQSWTIGMLDVPGWSKFTIYDNGGGGERLNILTTGHIEPGGDNGQNLGSGAKRLAAIYAGTGTINTSDAREKAWRGGVSPAELRAARRIVGELGFYQWTEAIAAKGKEEARYHFGVRAQAAWAIMADERLIDPVAADGTPGATPYAFLCWDAWEDDESGEARGRFGIRPDQLALFLIAAQDARIAALEAAA